MPTDPDKSDGGLLAYFGDFTGTILQLIALAVACWFLGSKDGAKQNFLGAAIAAVLVVALFLLSWLYSRRSRNALRIIATTTLVLLLSIMSYKSRNVRRAYRPEVNTVRVVQNKEISALPEASKASSNIAEPSSTASRQFRRGVLRSPKAGRTERLLADAHIPSSAESTATTSPVLLSEMEGSALEEKKNDVEQLPASSPKLGWDSDANPVPATPTRLEQPHVSARQPEDARFKALAVKFDRMSFESIERMLECLNAKWIPGRMGPNEAKVAIARDGVQEEWYAAAVARNKKDEQSFETAMILLMEYSGTIEKLASCELY